MHGAGNIREGGRIAATCVLLLFIPACSATMVKSPGNRASALAYAPMNEPSLSGLVKYLNEGADTIVAQRRDDAYRQMFTACNGAYKIDAEGPQAEGATVVPLATGGMAFLQSQYSYIQFSCVSQ
jgi:hypothetical protein